jgi:hypothetical protein
LVDFFGNLVHESLSVESDDSGKAHVIELLNDLRGILISLIVELHEDVGLLELLKGVSDDLSGSVDVVVSALSLSLLFTENGPESSDSRLRLKENFSSQSSSSDVEPVWVLWGDFLGNASLDILIS